MAQSRKCIDGSTDLPQSIFALNTCNFLIVKKRFVNFFQRRTFVANDLPKNITLILTGFYRK